MCINKSHFQLVLFPIPGAITSLSQATKPNAGQPVPLLCEAMDTPSVPGPNALTLTGSDGVEVTASETTVVASNRRVTTFIVTVVDLGNEFTCSLLDSDGTTVVDRQTISVNVYGKRLITKCLIH